MTTLNTGAPHFKSVMKQHRHANYTLSKVLNEFIDNVIKKTNDIRVYTQIDDSEKLQEVKVSDNYINGFENLDNDGKLSVGRESSMKRFLKSSACKQAISTVSFFRMTSV